MLTKCSKFDCFLFKCFKNVSLQQRRLKPCIKYRNPYLKVRCQFVVTSTFHGTYTSPAAIMKVRNLPLGGADQPAKGCFIL